MLKLTRKTREQFIVVIFFKLLSVKFKASMAVWWGNLLRIDTVFATLYSWLVSPAVKFVKNLENL